MHLAHLRLRDFRNYPRLDVDFLPGFHLVLGDNAQGKTNILEAIYLLATLRSFRGVGGAQMVRHGHKGYFVGGNVVGQGEHEVRMYWSASERSLALDGRTVRKLTDYLVVLRTVVFCTEDLQLVKGTGAAGGAFSICCFPRRIRATCYYCNGTPGRCVRATCCSGSARWTRRRWRVPGTCLFIKFVKKFNSVFISSHLYSISG